MRRRRAGRESPPSEVAPLVLQPRLAGSTAAEQLSSGAHQIISDTIDSLDLSASHARNSGGGSRNQRFHPAMMVKVLVYGYATEEFWSRKLAKKLDSILRQHWAVIIGCGCYRSLQVGNMEAR